MLTTTTRSAQALGWLIPGHMNRAQIHNPLSWPLRVMTGGAPQSSRFLLKNSLSSCHRKGWVNTLSYSFHGVPGGWERESFLRHQVFLIPHAPCGSQEVRGDGVEDCQGEAVVRMGLGCRAEFCFAFLVCLFPTLVPGQTTPAFVPFLGANCKAVTGVS